MRRSLAHYRRPATAVAAGAAVGTAVLAGALAVGDSIRASLARLALDRLGRIEHALESRRFFREALAAPLGAAPAVVGRGAARHAVSGARASRVTVLGVDGRFAALFPALEPPLDVALGAPASRFPPLVLNRTLADELGAVTGDEVLVSLERPGEVALATPLGRRDPEDRLLTLRLSVAAIVPARGAGRFSLLAGETHPLTAFVALGRLQAALGGGGRANTLLVPAAAGDGAAVAQALGRAVTLADLGLGLRPGEGYLALESDQVILPPAAVRAAAGAAAALGARRLEILTYLANRISLGERSVPYSTVSALEEEGSWPGDGLRLEDGSAAPAPGDGEILLDAWTARELEAHPGERVTLEYFVVGAGERLGTERHDFRVAGVLEKSGLAADRRLAPSLEGIEDAADMAAWDPPFPVDLRLIQPRDEEYWDRHGAAPKAIVAGATGRRLWSSRLGELTSVRIATPPAADPGAFSTALAGEILARLPPERMGLALAPVRRQGLAAAQGSADFAGLFVAFSSFLIAAAALLVALLFALLVERRACEVGLLLALGFPLARVRRRFLGEGLAVLLLGTIAGVPLAALYTRLVVGGIRRGWRGAFGDLPLEPHVGATSLAVGAAVALAVGLLAVALVVRRLGGRPPAALLGGRLEPDSPACAPRTARRIAWIASCLAGAIALLALLGGHASSPALSFAAGVCTLAGTVAALGGWASGGARLRTGRLAPASLALGFAARSPGRSLVVVALVACASFVLVVTAANRRPGGGDASPAADPATGGFALVAEARVPLPRPPAGAEDRALLGFRVADEALLAGVAVAALRLSPGEDASCLNLYRPTRPRLLGVPPGLGASSSFRFAATLAPAEDPWSLLDLDLGPGVVAAVADAESARWILKLGIGDELTIASEGGEPVRLRLVATLAGGLFQSELLVSERSLLHHFPGTDGYSFFLVRTPQARAGEVAALLESRLQDHGFDAVSTAARLASYREVQNAYLATFQVLGGLGLVLGTLGLGAVLARNVLERRAELAALRAFGFRARKLAALVAAESGLLLVAGVAAGALAALVAVLPHLVATSAGLPWRSLALTLGAVLAAGFASSAVAAWLALRAPLLPALKNE